jgi:hypothetical protein
MRAPDIAVGNVPDEPGWVRGMPPLAVEYADVGQDEADLQAKIRTLLDAGTRFVWVVRLTGVRRVEVYQPGVPYVLAYPGQHLEAPGILSNPVPMEALYDPDAAHEAVLRNLLQRRGYADLEAVRKEGELAMVLRLLERRIGAIAATEQQRIRAVDSDRLTALAESSAGFIEQQDLDS